MAMPYSSVSELPPAVKDRIKSSKKRRQWLHVWNSEYAAHGDESRAFGAAWAAVQKMAKETQVEAQYQLRPRGSQRCGGCSMFRTPNSCTKVLGEISPHGWCKFFDPLQKALSMTNFNFFTPISKIDAEQRMVWGYASTPSIDLDGEVVSLNAIKSALPDYWQWRNIREMHQPSAVGVAKEANVDDKGLYLGAKIVDDEAWKKVIEGVYRGFSIGGQTLKKTGNTIEECRLIEISIVDRPANPDCKIEMFKGEKKISGSGAKLVKTKSVDVIVRPDSVTRDLAKAIKAMAKAKDSDGSAPYGDVEYADPGYQADKQKRYPIDTEEHIRAAWNYINKKKNMGKYSPEDAAKVKAKIVSAWKSKVDPAGPPSAKIAQVGAKPTNAKFLDLDKVVSPKPSAAADISSDELVKLLLGDSRMDPMELLEELAKRSRPPSKADYMKMADDEVRKARKAMKECVKLVKAVHGITKARMMAKAAGKKPADDGEDDDAAMVEKLYKAFGAAQRGRVFGKAAREHIRKAAGWIGDRARGIAGGTKDYTVPAGTELHSTGDMTEGKPPVMDPIKPYPGKAATATGVVSVREAELMVEKAKLEGKVEALEKLPAVGGRRPAVFDVATLGGGNRGSLGKTQAAEALYAGVDLVKLHSNREHIAETEAAKIFGNLVLSNKFGRTVTDPAFQGKAA